MTTSNRRKTMLTLPEDVATAFLTLDTDTRDAYIVALRNAGWTLQAIAMAAAVSRERIRQIARDTSLELEDDLPIPLPPEKHVKAVRVIKQPSEANLKRMLELQPEAQKVRANSPNYRQQAEEYTELVHYETQVMGVSLYTLSKLLGVSHAALRFRLARYGYTTPAGGTSKAYTPIKEANRVENIIPRV